MKKTNKAVRQPVESVMKRRWKNHHKPFGKSYKPLKVFAHPLKALRKLLKPYEKPLATRWLAVGFCPFNRKPLVYVFAWDRFSSMKKTLNGHFLFKLQYNCPVFPSNIKDWQRPCQLFFDMLILFCGEDYGSVSWNSPIGDYQIFDWRVNILIQMERSVRRHSDYSKRPPVHAGGFSLLPPQSPCCFSVLTRLYYVACPTKIVMPRR